jgi:hypothetical protein
LSDDSAFAEWLLAQGRLSKDELRRAREAQRGRQGRLDTEILDLGLMSETALLEALGTFHKTRTASGADLEHASSAALRMLTPRIASRLEVVPFRLEGRTLSVATLSPGDLLVEDEIAQQTGCMVASFVALEIRFVEALHRHYQAPITARYAGLIRRLHRAQGPGAAPERRRSTPEPEPAPPRSASGVSLSGPKTTGQRPRRPAVEDQVELSGDELEQFPSLRFETVDGDDASTELSGAKTLERTLPEPEPGAGSDAEPAARAERGPGPGPDRELGTPGAEGSRAPEPAAEVGPEELLAAASLAMQNVEMRDDIADAMLGFCAPFLSRRIMLMHRQGTILGWRGEGAGVDETAVRAIEIPADEPSVFSGLLRGVEFWLGPLPTMPHNTELVLGLGGPPPKDCYILPVRVRDKVVCFLYGDNRTDGVGGLPLSELRRLATKASLGFQVYLMKGKIRTS